MKEDLIKRLVETFKTEFKDEIKEDLTEDLIYGNWNGELNLKIYNFSID